MRIHNGDTGASAVVVGVCPSELQGSVALRHRRNGPRKATTCLKHHTRSDEETEALKDEPAMAIWTNGPKTFHYLRDITPSELAGKENCETRAGYNRSP